MLDVNRMGIDVDSQRLAGGLPQPRRSVQKLHAHSLFDIIVCGNEFDFRVGHHSTVNERLA